jgi:hypothetical protein
MVLNIITDDFDNFYEIQDDLGRFVHYYYYLFYIDNKMISARRIDIHYMSIIFLEYYQIT